MDKKTEDIKTENKKEIQNAPNQHNIIVVRTNPIWTAIIAIIAILGFALSAINYYQQKDADKPNVVVSQLGQDSVSFEPVQGTDGWKNPYRVICNIRLENLSNKPITITQFELFYDGHRYVSNSRIKASKNQYIIYRSSASDTIPAYKWFDDIGKEQLLPLFIIEPWGAREGFVFFITDEQLANDETKGQLVVDTTRGKFKCDTSLYTAKYYYEDILKLQSSRIPDYHDDDM